MEKLMETMENTTEYAVEAVEVAQEYVPAKSKTSKGIGMALATLAIGGAVYVIHKIKKNKAEKQDVLDADDAAVIEAEEVESEPEVDSKKTKKK